MDVTFLAALLQRNKRIPGHAKGGGGPREGGFPGRAERARSHGRCAWKARGLALAQTRRSAHLAPGVRKNLIKDGVGAPLGTGQRLSILV